MRQSAFFLRCDMLYKAHRTRCDSRRSGGFTLIELLVVISVISMLMAVLLPSLQAARDRAKRTVCACRLKQWAVAFNCYAAENNDAWPHCDGLDRGPRSTDDPRISKEDLADWHGWMDVLPPMIDLEAWRDYPRYQRPGQNTFYQCPAAEPLDAPGMYSYRPEREGYFSYAMNSCLELDKNAWPPPENYGYPMPSFLDTAKIKCPQRVYVLFDQLLDPRKGFDANIVYRGAGKYSGSYPKSFSARHRAGESELGGNMLHADGHVDWLRRVWKRDWGDEVEVPPRDDPNWYPYPVKMACRE
jgi:prepilin-type N-terminal cleavage/methylation domain-containing protein/prepilin-type processing-associated H-X9-DG protein